MSPVQNVTDVPVHSPSQEGLVSLLGAERMRSHFVIAVAMGPALRAGTKRTMLGDSLVLRLNFPRRADSSCAFQLLRKRESTGATVISVRECPEVETGPRVTVSRTLQPGAIALVMQNLDFLPSHLGPLSYDVVAQTDDSNPPRYARAHRLLRSPKLRVQRGG